MRNRLKIIDVFTVSLFFVLISFPLLNSYLNIVDDNEGTENRSKEKRPQFDISNLDNYTKAYDNYYNDNFNLRNKLIRFYNNLEFKLFNVSPVPSTVTVGKDGWLYASKSKQNYIGLNQFSKNEIKQIKNELIKRTEWCEERNIKYYVAIIPNKMNFYPNYLPRQIIKKRDSSRYDQFVSLKSVEGVNIVDVKRYLEGNKENGENLFQKTDDHWNDLGAYYGYRAIIDRVAIDFPEIKPKPIEDYVQSVIIKTGNMAVLANLEESYSENYIQLDQIDTSYAVDGTRKGYPVPETISRDSYEIVKYNKKGKPYKCLIIRDSFGLFLIKFFQEHFQEIVAIQDEWKYRMREDIIEQEQPDIIINIILETYIDELIKNPFNVTENREL